MSSFVSNINSIQYFLNSKIFIKISQLFFPIGYLFFINKILLLRSKSEVLVGQPFLSIFNIKILGKIIRHLKFNKVFIFGMKNKKKYRKFSTYRHNITIIQPII